MVQVYPRRAYANLCEVQPGDIVRLLDGKPGEQSEPPAFSDAIIVEIGLGYVLLARPHVYLQPDGQVQVRTEQYRCPLALLVERHEVLTTGSSGSRDNRLRPFEPYFSVLVPWSDTPTRWHPTDRVGPFSTLSRGAFKSRSEALAWAREKLEGQPFELRYCDPMSDPEVRESYERITGNPIDILERMRLAYGSELALAPEIRERLAAGDSSADLGQRGAR